MCEDNHGEDDRGLMSNEQRTVYLPLESIKLCNVCGKKGGRLQICGNCGESVYCGSDCQKKDWPSHKKMCGKTDRIDLASFYPLVAVLMDIQRIHPKKPLHPALTHKIINSPNPDSEGVCKFPDGSSARLILLGDEISLEEAAHDPKGWWPSAVTDAVRRKLYRRFASEHFLLPSIVATLVALMAEMYTTTYVAPADASDGELKRRIRLKYHNSPIADFGIVKGWADVKSQDTFAYFNLGNGSFTKGQDPSDHYWIYFTTAAGEDFILDCGMFTFNYCILVKTDAYIKHGLPPALTFAPAYFRDRFYKQTAPNIEYEKQRFSVLRDPELGEAVHYSRKYFRGHDTGIICRFMEKVAGRPCSKVEEELVMTWLVPACDVISLNLAHREYLNYPESPPIALQTDPGEMDNTPAEADEAWLKYMKKWNRKQRKGTLTNEQLGKAFNAWKELAKKEEKSDQEGGKRDEIVKTSPLTLN